MYLATWSLPPDGLYSPKDAVYAYSCADVLCCTVECAPRGGDTLVLDEVHWLTDPDRGSQ